MEPYQWTIHEARRRLDNKDISSVELTRSVLARVKAVDGAVKAFNLVTDDRALADAADADRAIARGETGVLTGIPIALKDNMDTAGIETTCSSRILAGYKPPFDGTVPARLKAGGAVLVGKTNLDEFAMGSSTENSATGATRNPWNLERAPGGSSGGSAAAVAADMCLGSLGSDTGGSIRQPAALCGVVGLKPTYGRVSRYGLVAFASSLDQIGPFTKDVRDSALLLEAISGADPLDSTCSTRPVDDYAAALERGVKGLTIGVPREYFIKGTDPSVEKAVQASIRVLEGQGATLREISLPHTAYAVACYYLVATAEASSNLGRYDGVRYGLREEAGDLLEMYMATREAGFGTEVKRRIMLGTYALSAGYYDAYYRKAQQVRTLILRDFTKAFDAGVDLVVTPTSPTGAFRIGEKADDPLQMYLSDIFTISANLAGLPGISVPCGFDDNGCPVGLQLIGRAWDESTLLAAARAHEAQTSFHTRRPDL
ncbi:MAG: Asp-tRNA(Asn)/Glu-tRNA(Gln) amidotransferase subunit GatA [Nitrospirota bacterium]|nr:Asp-tRNA(Asn)/Glu-tRNA(Gln) amidotransferase subunit GatA [Nitrospirota bacterium]